MKRMKILVGKILLFTMTIFVGHDYLVGQQDIGGETRIAAPVHQTCAKTGTHTVCVEHQVFHAPALERGETIQGSDLKAGRAEFFLPTLHAQPHPETLQTPPKLA